MDGGSWMVISFSFLLFLFYSFFGSNIYKVFFVVYVVFHVTDLNGNKLTDERVIRHIEQVNMIYFRNLLPKIIVELIF